MPIDDLLESMIAASSAFRFDGVIIRSHPLLCGSSLSVSGFAVTSWFAWSIVPVRGDTKSDTALIDSALPNGAFALTVPPGLGSSTNAFSRSCFLSVVGYSHSGFVAFNFDPEPILAVA